MILPSENPGRTIIKGLSKWGVCPLQNRRFCSTETETEEANKRDFFCVAHYLLPLQDWGWRLNSSRWEKFEEAQPHTESSSGLKRELPPSNINNNTRNYRSTTGKNEISEKTLELCVLCKFRSSVSDPWMLQMRHAIPEEYCTDTGTTLRVHVRTAKRRGNQRAPKTERAGRSDDDHFSMLAAVPSTCFSKKNTEMTSANICTVSTAFGNSCN